jgi:hypothetical protein
MPREAAVVLLTALIDALPNEGTIDIPTKIAADLVALLPRGNSLNVRSSVRLFAPAGPQQTQILMVLSAFAIMTLIVFAISAADPGGPGIGENPLPPRANDTTMVMPRRERQARNCAADWNKPKIEFPSY